MSTNKVVGIVLVTLASMGVAGVLGLWFVFSKIRASGITTPVDNVFGDQHLKTAVALVELHKTRYGVYPAGLSELTFTGQWDRIHTVAVSYCSNETRSAYFLEVKRGWIGKPTFVPKPEFWQGTGYDPDLGPCD